MAARDPADLDAKDRRIDALVAQAEKLIRDLNATVADMKRILTAAGAEVIEQQEQSARERRGRR